jgi:hypothetical protein
MPTPIRYRIAGNINQTMPQKIFIFEKFLKRAKTIRKTKKARDNVEPYIKAPDAAAVSGLLDAISFLVENSENKLTVFYGLAK